MPSEAFLQVNQLSRYYNDVCAVDNISFELRKGEVLGFLGPNGAGKSTTMQMLTGVLAPSSGEIRIRDVDLLTHASRAKAHIGYLPEQPPLYPDLSVDTYLRFCAGLRRMPRKQWPDALTRCKKRCGLETVGHRLVGNLSKGFQQRVGIAQAIIHSPDIVILDEPTVGLDPIQIREIRQLIRDLGGEHSVILSSHILSEIQSTCDRVQIINKGKLVFSERMDTLQGQQGKTLILGLHNPPTTSVISDLAMVDSVARKADGMLRITLRTGLRTDLRTDLPGEADPTETLLRLALDQHWGLYHLSLEQRSLEEIFIDIISQDLVDDPNHPAATGETTT